MKKFFIVLLCLTITMPAFARVAPPPEHIQKWLTEHRSHLKNCPADKPLYTEYGECRSCDDTRSFKIPFYVQDFCHSICPNRISTVKIPFGVQIDKNYKTWTAYCVLKDAPGPDFYFDEYSVSWIKIKNCPDDKPLYYNGKCAACDEYDNWDNVKNILGCEKCPNKVIKGNACYLNCPDDKPLIMDDCYNCSNDEPFNPFIRRGEAFCVHCGDLPDKRIISGHDRCTQEKKTAPFKKNSSNKTHK